MAVAAADAVALRGAVELDADEDLAAPAFDPAGADRRAGGQADVAAMFACGQVARRARIRRNDSNRSTKRTATRAATSPPRCVAAVTASAS